MKFGITLFVLIIVTFKCGEFYAKSHFYPVSEENAMKAHYYKGLLNGKNLPEKERAEAQKRLEAICEHATLQNVCD